MSQARDIACSATVGLTLALTSAMSIQTVGFREMSLFANSDTRMLLLAVSTYAIFLASSVLCYAVLRNANRILRFNDTRNPFERLRLSFNRQSILVASTIIFVCWIPWIALEYPCSMNADTYNQLYQFKTSSPTFYTTIGTTVDESFIDHHPVFDSLVFGAFLFFGEQVGAQNAGLLAYSIFQCLLTTIMLATSCCYLERLRVPKLFRIAALAFCALFPPIPLWSTCMVKDSLNACFFGFFCILAAEAVRTKGDFFQASRNVALFILVACLCIMTKKTGVIVVLSTGLALATIVRKQWMKLVAGAVGPIIICFGIIPAVLYPAIGGVAPGGSQEMFGFAFQQVITAINENDDLTAHEHESVSAVLDIEAAQKSYSPDSVDRVKGCAVHDASFNDYLAFIPSYFSIGLRHVPAYTESVFFIIGSLVTPGRTFTFFTTPEQPKEWKAVFANADTKHELHLDFNKPEPVASMAASFEQWWRATIPSLGPFQVLFDVGLYGGWLPLACIVICLFKCRRWTIALVPMIVTLCIIAMSPASLVRYVLPMLYATPIMLGILCIGLRTCETSANDL